jgi:hypothetical protein
VQPVLPAAKGKSDVELNAMALQLHEAQSCLAREHPPHTHRTADCRLSILRTVLLKSLTALFVSSIFV